MPVQWCIETRKLLNIPEATPEIAVPKIRQTLQWDIPEAIEFGTALNTLPTVTIVSGNQMAVPVYTPALNTRRPGFGDHTLRVVVPGDDTYEETQLVKPLHVKRRILVLKAPHLYMEHGADVPVLMAECTGTLAEGDAITLSCACEVTRDSEQNLDGYPVIPQITWTSGLAGNYEVQVSNGSVKVRPGADEMEQQIKGLRQRYIALLKKVSPEERIIMEKLFDEIRDARLDVSLDVQSEKLRELAIEVDKLEYIKVTGVVLTLGAATLSTNETVKCTVTISPPEATQQAVEWSVDKPELATIDQEGNLSRTGANGGVVRVTATSKCRDNLFHTAVISVIADPISIEVLGPFNTFLDDTIQMTARVLPPEASQAVTWLYTKGKSKNVAFSKNGIITISKPTSAGGSWAGTLWVQAISSANSDIVSEETPVRFEGLKTTRIEMKAPKKKIAIGEQIIISASITPNEAKKAVTWSVDDPSMATLENQEDLSVTMTMLKGGTVRVQAHATDGSGIEHNIAISAPITLTNFDVSLDHSDIGLVDTAQITPIFTPSEAICRVNWALTEDSAAATLVNGIVYPNATGTIKVIVSVPDTDFSKQLEIKVTASEGMAVGAAQWPHIQPLIDKFAARIKISENERCQEKYRHWLYDMRKKILHHNETRTLRHLKNELIALRNTHYCCYHTEWLELAGFSSGGNCYIRNDQIWTHLGTDYRVHMTMFPTDASIEVGSDFDALEKKIYRVNKGGFKSMHATLYVRPDSKEDQCKTYTGGDNWTPPYAVKRYLGGQQAYEELVEELDDWMQTQRNVAATALRQLFDHIHENDGDNIG